jgi:hypothetical protein
MASERRRPRQGELDPEKETATRGGTKIVRENQHTTEDGTEDGQLVAKRVTALVLMETT